MKSRTSLANNPSYPEYKHSGVVWVGNLPAGWDILPNRAIFQEVDEKNHPNETMLSVTISRGIIKQSEYLEDSTKRDSSNSNKSKYKLVQEDDIAYNKMRAWQGAFGVSKYRGIVSPAYIIVRLRSKELYPRYYHYLFRTPVFAKEAERWSYGITSDMWSLRPEHFKQIYSPIPPPSEQAAIIRFLDYANRKIDKYVNSKKRLIKLLEEQKQAIIHKAVTRGIDPDVPMKDSGVDWLGQIPSHWDPVRNMALFSQRVESGIEGLTVLQVSLRSGISAEELDQFGRPKRLIADATKYKLIRKDDIAYNTMRLWQGAVGVSPSDGLVSPAYVVLKARSGVYPKYYDYLFHTEVYKQQVNRVSTGIVSDRNRCYWDSFKQIANVRVPLNEQKEIVQRIENETESVNQTIDRARKEIDLLNEYRTRLTADVVTGKLDVREAAKNLPNLEEEALEEADEFELDEEELEAVED